MVTFVGLTFTGCQKDDLEEKTQSTEKAIVVNAEQTFNVKKFTITKPGIVYVVQSDGTLKMHKTLKIRNLDWSVAQEWFLEDLQTGGFEDFSFYPGDDGSVHGYYYPWKGQIQNAANKDDWKNMIFQDESYSPISGNPFRLPRLDGDASGDFKRLASALGSTSLIRSKLQVAYDDVDIQTGIFDNSEAAFWMEVRGTNQEANLQPDCGALAKWVRAKNDEFRHLYTNIKTLKANVRLMRDIKAAQW